MRTEAVRLEFGRTEYWAEPPTAVLVTLFQNDQPRCLLHHLGWDMKRKGKCK